MEFCIQDEAAFMSSNPFVREKAFDRARQLGAKNVRLMLYTFQLHPCRGAEAAARLLVYQQAIASAKRRGMKVQFVITGVAAGWGTPTKGGRACAKPTGLKPTTKGLVKFINKYVPFFAKKGVKRWSIWNEPNLGSFLCAGSGVGANGNIDHAKCKGSSLKKQAKLYRKLYKAGYSAIMRLVKKGKAPKSTQVLIGELAAAHAGDKFMNYVLQGKGTLKTHGLASHPYQYCTNPKAKSFKFTTSCRRKMTQGIAWTKDWRARLSKWQKARKLTTPSGKVPPLFLTEFGYHRTGPYAVPEAVRAKWYKAALDVAKKGKAKQMTLYQLFPSGPGAWDTGVLDPNGNALPSFYGIYNWAKKNRYPVRKL